MSYLKAKQALLTKLLAAAIVPDADIAFQNKSFDPKGKTLWLDAHFLPSTSEMLGKQQRVVTRMKEYFRLVCQYLKMMMLLITFN